MEKKDRVKSIVRMYNHQSVMNHDAPIHPFAAPNAWLNRVCEVEEAIDEAKSMGVRFLAVELDRVLDRIPKAAF